MKFFVQIILIGVVIFLDVVFVTFAGLSALLFVASLISAPILWLLKRRHAAKMLAVAGPLSFILALSFGGIVNQQIEYKVNLFVSDIKKQCLVECPRKTIKTRWGNYHIQYSSSRDGKMRYVLYNKFGFQSVVLDLSSGQRFEKPMD